MTTPAPPQTEPSPAVPVAASWEALLAAALVGTARRRPPPAPLRLGPDPDLDDHGDPAAAPPPNRRSSPRPSPGEERQFHPTPAPPPNRRSSPRPSPGEERQFDPTAAPPPNRRATPRPAPGGERQLPEGAGRADPAAELLATAAVLATCRRAGALPGRAPAELPAPADPDDRAPCTDAAVDVLELILSGEVPVPGGVTLLAGDWLAGAARAGCRPPARLLPRLLELGSGAPSVRPALQQVVGSRGRWLAGHDDRWRWAAADPIDSDDDEAAAGRFATAARPERVTLFDALRRADPRRGRDVLAAAWAKEPAADRAAFLAQLAVGLSDDDEPFLEAALDDRSAAVRATAAGLLAGLPASRRAGRMADRLRPLIAAGGPPGDARGASAGPGGGRGRGLTVSRPPEPDPAARRDGVDDAPPAGMGVAAWRLAQLVAGTPLSFWEEQLGVEPAEVVELAAEHSPPVLAGLELAAVGQAGRADPAWAVALFRHRPTPAVLAGLPPDLAAGELAAALARGLAPRAAVAELFAACPGPWPGPLADAVVDRYRRLGSQAAAEVPAALPVLAARLDPSALPLVETWAATLAGEHGLRRRVQTLGHALSLRAVINREFPT